MTASAVMDAGELRRWVACAAVVLGVHAAAVTMLTRWQVPLTGEDEAGAIMVDLAPFLAPETDTRQDLAPGPDIQIPQMPQADEKPPEKAEEKIELPPPVPQADVVIPPELVKPPEIPKEETPPPQMTAPPRPRPPSPGRIASWNRSIVKQIEQHKGYPPAAHARREQGVAQLAFTLDRQGQVTAARVIKSSGFPLLDQETIATVRRAQPFPAPPPDMAGESFDFTIPIGFHIR